MKLSVVMPVYNERSTLRSVVKRVLEVPIDVEMICIDDGSNDGSREMLVDLENQFPTVRILLQHRNMGKVLRCAVESRKPQAISSSFRMQIWNMTLANIQFSW